MRMLTNANKSSADTTRESEETSQSTHVDNSNNNGAVDDTEKAVQKAEQKASPPNVNGSNNYRPIREEVALKTVERAIRKSPYINKGKQNLRKLYKNGKAHVNFIEHYSNNSKQNECFVSSNESLVITRISISAIKNSILKSLEFDVSPAIALHIISKLQGRVNASERLGGKEILKTKIEEVSNFEEYKFFTRRTKLQANADEDTDKETNKDNVNIVTIPKSIKSQKAANVTASYSYTAYDKAFEMLTVKAATDLILIDARIVIEITTQVLINARQMRENINFRYPLVRIVECCAGECMKLANIVEYQEDADVLKINGRGGRRDSREYKQGLNSSKSGMPETGAPNDNVSSHPSAQNNGLFNAPDHNQGQANDSDKEPQPPAEGSSSETSKSQEQADGKTKNLPGIL